MQNKRVSEDVKKKMKRYQRRYLMEIEDKVEIGMYRDDKKLDKRFEKIMTIKRDGIETPQELETFKDDKNVEDDVYHLYVKCELDKLRN